MRESQHIPPCFNGVLEQNETADPVEVASGISGVAVKYRLKYALGMELKK